MLSKLLYYILYKRTQRSCLNKTKGTYKKIKNHSVYLKGYNLFLTPCLSQQRQF
jgi:hypothetical protein